MVAMTFLHDQRQGVHVSQTPDPTATQLALHPVQTAVLRRQTMSSRPYLGLPLEA